MSEFKINHKLLEKYMYKLSNDIESDDEWDQTFNDCEYEYLIILNNMLNSIKNDIEYNIILKIINEDILSYDNKILLINYFQNKNKNIIENKIILYNQFIIALKNKIKNKRKYKKCCCNIL